MKICFFSDIHGNYEAFSAGYQMVLDEHADINIFLGDICGYYFDTMKIWADLKECPNLITLLGNHDKIFLESYANGAVPSEYTKKYGPALDMLLHTCSESFIEWLKKSRLFFSDESISLFCCHGGPNDPINQYIYPDTELPEVNAKHVIMGHTHYPMYRSRNGHCYGNPGSMGQPRDGGNPSFAILRTGKIDSWEIRRFVYNKISLIRKIDKMPVPVYLQQVLWR